MLRILPLLLIAFALIAPAADAAAKPTCRSGDAVYKKQGVRVFYVYRGGDDYYYACGPRTRKPVLLEFLPQAYGGLGVFGRSGDKVLWTTGTSGEGGGEYSTVGWFDVRTSQVRTGELVGEAGNDVVDMVVAANGGVGVVVGIEDAERDVRVGYLAPGSKRGQLRGELALATAGERYVKRSLAFAGASLTWKLEGGVQRSAPLTGEPLICTAGTTIVESDGARVFEVLQGRKDILAACSAGETTPRRLVVEDVARQNHWVQLLSVKRAGARIGFVAGTGIGLLEGGQATFTRPDDIVAVQDVAFGATGPVVFAGTTKAEQDVIALVTGQRLATQGGKLKPGTLAIGERVTWETTDGVAQSTPLAGETTVDCAAGSTVHARDGLRVFELLLAGAPDARLFACTPGAGAPVQLLSAPRTASWRIFELARKDGRFAIVAGSESRGAEYRFVSFDADDAVVAVPKSALGGIKDVALAPDGRSAFALRDSGEWTIVAYAGGAERTVGRPRDGVQRGSLRFDGARLVWRNLSGAERSATVPVAATARAAAARDCRSGKTIYEQDGVRIFEDGRGSEYEWFGCGPGARSPASLFVNSGAYGQLRVFARDGDRVLLEGTFSGEGGGEETVVGFFDARTAQTHVGELATTGKVVELVVASDGGIGVVAGSRVGYLAPRADRELALSVVGEEYVPGSLAFGAGTLRWGGRSVPLTGEAVTCSSGTTLLERDGLRLFEVLPNRRTDRGAQADVLAVCPPGATTPRELAVSGLEHWTLREVVGPAFLAGRNGIGVLNGGQVRFSSSFRNVTDIAAGDAVVFAADGLIGRVTGTGWERVATAAVAPGSLAVAGGLVTWSTGSAPLGAETPVDCRTGTTHIRRRGLRVFETGRADKVLLACLDGKLVPLLAPIGRPRWTVTELGREHGRIGLLVHARGSETHDVISLDASGALVGQAYELGGSTKVRDVELAPDGRVAIATQRGRKWNIRAFPLAGPGELGGERWSAQPRDGVRALRFDGTDITWRDRAGKLRRAEIR